MPHSLKLHCKKTLYAPRLAGLDWKKLPFAGGWLCRKHSCQLAGSSKKAEWNSAKETSHLEIVTTDLHCLWRCVYVSTATTTKGTTEILTKFRLYMQGLSPGLAVS